jgi:RNA polymerase sigma-70 factor, ECF subfamily
MEEREKLQFQMRMAAVAQNRDQAAFAELFDYFAPRLKSWLLRQRMEPGQAEELVQEVMIVLWHKAHLYDPAKSSLSTWLFRIARNRRIDMARRDKSRVMDETDPAFQPAAQAGADALVENADRENYVREALEKLPREQIDLVRMAFFLGRSHSEIAQESGLPLGTVKSRLRLAFGRLKKILSESGIDSAF